MEFKKLRAVTLKNVGESGTGLAVFATLNIVDKDGDVTLPGAFGEQLVPILPAHDREHIPLGKAKISERGNEALAALTLNLGVAAARDWHSALKFDLAHPPAIQEWSYGFEVLDKSYGEHQGRRVRFLKRLKVNEVSPVVVGAGEMTRTVLMKDGARWGQATQSDLRNLHAAFLATAARYGKQQPRAAEGRTLYRKFLEALG